MSDAQAAEDGVPQPPRLCSREAEVVTYPQNLFSLARTLIDEGRFSIAVIVAHMACEIATERSALTGDEVQTAAFWQKFKESAQRR
jgi:hypothetical protein